MLSHVFLGTNDLERAERFYALIFQLLGVYDFQKQPRAVRLAAFGHASAVIYRRQTS